jgi:sigma-E factor negative regulatory protein RseC
MIEQTALVTATKDDIAYVEVHRQSTCGQCSVQKGCGTSVFSKVLGNKFSELTVLNPVHAEKGDVVILGLHESVLIKTALLMYMFPLIMMFVGAISVVIIEQWLNLNLGQGWVILASFISLLAAFLYIKKISRKHMKNGKYQPVILGKATFSDIQASPFKVNVN